MTSKKIGRITGPVLFLRRLILFSAPVWAGAIQGQTVAWNVNGLTAAGSSPLAATTLESPFSIASLTLGSGVTPSSTLNTFGGTAFDQTSFADAVDGNDYLSFIVTPTTGANFNLLSISLIFGVGVAVTNFNVALTTSVSGFASGDGLWTHSFSTASPAAQSIALSDFPAL
jgi:hypothetical protein